jgi:hypothetical protein
MCFGKTRSVFDRFTQDFFSRRLIACLQQRHPQIVTQVGIPRPQAQSALQKINPCFDLPGLTGKHAEQSQGLRMVGLPTDNFPVEILGPLQVTLAMEPGCGREKMGD